MAVDTKTARRGVPPLEWDVVEECLCGGPHHVERAASPEGRMSLSAVDRIIAPVLFFHLAVVYPAPGLDAEHFKAALHSTLAQYPALCGRIVTDESGTPHMANLSAGAALLLGRSSASLADVCPSAPPAGGLVAVPELPAALFGHLPPVATPAYVDHPDMPVTHVALAQLEGGGSVLGVRLSHMLADWGAARGFLRRLTCTYRAAVSSNGTPAAPPPPPDAAPLVEALLAAQQLPPGFSPVRLRVLGAAEGAELTAAAATTRPTVRTTWHVTAEQLAGINARAAATLPAGGDASDGARWVSAHDALTALVWQAVARLPRRRGLQHDLPVAMDMRRRLGIADDARGNVMWNAKGRYMDAASTTLGEVAAELRASYDACAAQFLPDVAWARQRMAAGEAVMWNSPADMAGDMRRGLSCSINETQWPLDFDEDVCCGDGLAPVLAVPGMSVPMFFPLALTQQAPGGRGAWLVHLWLQEEEVAQIRAAWPALCAEQDQKDY